MDKLEKKEGKKSLEQKLKEKGVTNIIFKPEGLGALEFDIEIVGKDFEKTSRPLRIERLSTDSFMKIVDKKDELKMAEEVLKNFVAYPIEARDKEFFNLDMDALLTIIDITVEFQQTPFLYIERYRK